jgi:hypothetical protein
VVAEHQASHWAPKPRVELHHFPIQPSVR